MSASNDDLKAELLSGCRIEFKNKEGVVVSFRDDMTIGELAEIGVQVRLSPIGEPTPDDVYVHVP